jgi:glutamine---fructose-6-phosphate transaminase (isomerizing)
MTSLLAQETGEQPAALARLLDAQLPRIATWRTALRRNEIDGLVVVARGSSDNAARYGQYLWSMRTGLQVTLATPSLHTVYGSPIDPRGKAVVAISQSGMSPDVVAVLEAARDHGSPAVAVTNDPDSPLAQAATDVLDLAVGPELSVAATKTYTASLLAVALLAVALAPPDEQSAYEKDLAGLPDAMAAVLGETTGIDRCADLLAAADRGVVVGRGLNLSTAFETALKLTELTGSLMAPYSPADLMHGPVAALGPETPAVLVAPDEPASASVLEIVATARERGAPVILVAPDPAPAAAGDVDTSETEPVVIPASAAVAGWLSPLVAVVPGQLLARAVAERRAVELDGPGGLSKVTLTT